MIKLKKWYIHCKSEEVYRFVVRNCQDFDQDTDFLKDAHVSVVGPEGKEKLISRDLIQINKQMVDLIEKYKRRFGNDSYEIYVQLSMRGKIFLWSKMYNFQQIKSSLTRKK